MRAAQPGVVPAFFNTGLYNVDGSGDYPRGNQGLFEHTSDPADRGKFRVPSLRNAELTGPYYHHGGMATLRDVVMFYVRGDRKSVV